MANATNQHRIRITLVAVVGVWLLLSGIHPRLGAISAQLDPSWHAVLAWALRHHEQWGRDIFFSYGPLGFLSPTATFNPHLYWLWLALTGIMAATLAALASHAVWRIPTAYSIAFLVGAIVLCANWVHTVGWLISYPLAALALQRCMHMQRLAAITLVAWLAFFEAQLPLIKFVNFPLWIVWIPIGCMVLWRQRALWTVFLATSILAPAVTWVACGQAMANYPAYLHSSLNISLHYSKAMQLLVMPAYSDPLALTVLLAALVGLGILALRQRHSTADLAITILAAATLILAYRSALLRADAHEFVFWATVCLLPPIVVGHAVATTQRPTCPWITAGGLLALPLMLMCTLAFVPTSASAIVTMVQPGLPLQNLAELLTLPEQYRQGMLATQTARIAMALPRITRKVGDAPIDLMMDAQGALLANHLNYRPRPAFQGYLAYSSWLLQANDRFLRSPDSADWMIVQLGTINGKYPNSDDAWTLLQVLQDFSPVMGEKGFLLLHRTRRSSDVTGEMNDKVTVPFRLNRPEPLPHLAGNAQFARLDVRLTLAGRIESLLFREPTLFIGVSTRDGRDDRFRLVRAVGKSGFLLSPALRNNHDYIEWLRGHDDRDVTRITVYGGTFLGMQVFRSAEPLQLSPRSLPRHAPKPSFFKSADSPPLTAHQPDKFSRVSNG